MVVFNYDHFLRCLIRQGAVNPGDNHLSCLLSLIATKTRATTYELRHYLKQKKLRKTSNWFGISKYYKNFYFLVQL